jgi:hypothetical protein
VIIGLIVIIIVFESKFGKSYDNSTLKRNVIDDISFDVDYRTVFGFLAQTEQEKLLE